MEIHNLDKITIIFAKAGLGLNGAKQCSEYEVLFFTFQEYMVSFYCNVVIGNINICFMNDWLNVFMCYDNTYIELCLE